MIPEKIYKIEYYRKVYKCKNCDQNGIKSNIVKAENKTPAPVIEKGLPDPSMVADIMQRKYQLGEPLYRQEQYWKLRGIYLNRTSLANWVIKGAKWFEPVIRQFWEYAYLEPVLNADETPTRVLKKICGRPAGLCIITREKLTLIILSLNLPLQKLKAGTMPTHITLGTRTDDTEN